MYDYCKEKDYVLPSVYQGAYNPLMRQSEQDLFPVLRELKMNFYAYSPLAGGIFARPLEQVLNPEKGSRFDAMKVFGKMYLSDQGTVARLRSLAMQCEKEGVSVLEATFRWLQYHSILQNGDAIIIGGSKVEQIDRSLACKDKGPLSAALVTSFNELKEQTI